jgi:anti-anti-sigma regulatory factor
MARLARTPAPALPAGESDALPLPVISDTAAAPMLHQQLLARVSAGTPLVLLCRDVERITTACVQLLLAADRSLIRRGAGLVARTPSEAMRAAFSELGLADELERWVQAHGYESAGGG